MKLITETIENIEVLTEERNGKKDYKIKGIFMQADIKNRNGRYGLRPDQLKFGDDKQILLTTDSNVKSYLLITEFRRNN